jgi:UDP-4-amino-4-deoxy-L-arabinose-oxoglutarate aminotransferase
VVQVDVDALGVERDAVIAALREEGVGAGLHFVPLHQLSLYRDIADPADLPVATEAGRRILTLPLFPDMSDADVDFVVDTLEQVVRRHTRSGA